MRVDIKAHAQIIKRFIATMIVIALPAFANRAQPAHVSEEQMTLIYAIRSMIVREKLVTEEQMTMPFAMKTRFVRAEDFADRAHAAIEAFMH